MRTCDPNTRSFVSHSVPLPQCCPVSGNPMPGSKLTVSYLPAGVVFPVEDLASFVAEYVGGRGDIRGMEEMVQELANRVRDAVGVNVRTVADLIINPPFGGDQQTMRVTARATRRTPETKLLNKPTEKQIEAARIAGDEAWKKWTGGRSSLDGMEAIVRAALSAALAVEAGTGLSVDALAQEIRRVDGNHSLGAGALAEALMPFLAALTPASSAVEGEAVAWQWRSRVKGGAWDAWENGIYHQTPPPFMEVEHRRVPASPAPQTEDRADG